jgi:oxygen-independent coproporphyrinogen-3 oxidase
MSLIRKYNVPGPRYTSYPTVPYWNEATFDEAKWQTSVKRSFDETNDSQGISLYIHLPFCESLCTFCGCFKRITKNHQVEQPYVAALLREWHLYCQLFTARPKIRELHLGGGTPTFFSSQNLEDLVNGIFAYADRLPDCEMSFEGHPNSTTREHLQTLYNLGFRRVSFGVQDYSDVVQKAIHRIQPFHQVAKVSFWAREIGYESVGHDLIFGLPMQTLKDVVDTIEKTISLHPDRLAFYSYAHVPWIKGTGQRGFKDEDVPKEDLKRELYETGKKMLLENGYVEIGMDHFALPGEGLYKATRNGKLHRNFMGYNATATQLMIGLGASSIGDSWYGFAQNVKSVEDYIQMVEWGAFPLLRGHMLGAEDLNVRRHILDLMCRFETFWNPSSEWGKNVIPGILESLSEMEADGLVVKTDSTLRVTDAGKPFVRNVCMAFDLLLQRDKPGRQLFSMTI